MRRIWRKAKQNQEKRFFTNNQIRKPFVFLVDENDDNIGKISTKEALIKAEQVDLDLVEVNPKTDPPVAKIMDYGQFKYEKEKKLHKQKLQSKKTEVKGVRISLRISSHDLELKKKQSLKFLEKGNKLKIELILKGRERQHVRKAIELLNNFVAELEKVENFNIIREQDLKKQGGRFNLILINKV